MGCSGFVCLTRFRNVTYLSSAVLFTRLRIPFIHFMSLSPTPRPATPTTILGVPGYRFGDLHDPDCLASLYERFCEDVRAADPELWREWEAYRSAPGAPRQPTTLSNLLVAMATHVSRFVTRLF
jgi:hypothetical protein